MKSKSMKNKPSKVNIYRKRYEEEGYDLVDITGLCKSQIGNSGWCNDFNEPDENIYHLRIVYRDEIIANVGGDGIELIDDEKYTIFEAGENDFTVFRLVFREEIE